MLFLKYLGDDLSNGIVNDRMCVRSYVLSYFSMLLLDGLSALSFYSISFRDRSADAK